MRAEIERDLAVGVAGVGRGRDPFFFSVGNRSAWRCDGNLTRPGEKVRVDKLVVRVVTGGGGVAGKCINSTNIGSVYGTAMNIVTNALIKRRGIAAIEDALRLGPVHLFKRNRPAAVVISEAEYARLTARDRGQPQSPKSASFAEWFMAKGNPGTLDARGLAARVAEARDGWNGR